MKTAIAISVAVAALFTNACSNDPGAVRELNQEENSPLEYQENLRLVYTDSALLRFELRAPVAANYPERGEEEPYTEFPEGIDVVFFDAHGNPESTMRGDYAIRYPNRYQWESRGDVIVVGKTGEKLKTEHLIWDERTEKIFSDEFVTINTGKEIFMGEGFEADQSFTEYEIKNIVGEISIDD
ncbi:MAG: LPS export ABC transporter periplasmic protein LptC [Cryomorphaceae bacterium]|nr:LPS export ABC transporter periplasmic protein LptC [Cryomorphaceae bacterium]